jgi:nitrogen fixation/metabolism regulation signal transduction histidine kinase
VAGRRWTQSPLTGAFATARSMKPIAPNDLRIATKINALTGLCAVLALSAAWLLVARTQATMERQQQALTAYMGQMDLARRMQVDFKKQVQEWKDILLRGQEPADLEKYRDQFFREQALVREDGQALIRMLDLPSSRALVAGFLQAHDDLGRRYRKSLEAFVQSGASDYRSSDHLVRGADRAPTDLVDAIVDAIAREVDSYKALHAAAFARERFDTAVAVAGIFLLLLGIGVAIARRILLPIHNLTRTVSRVSAENDYSLRAVRCSRDELGLLTDGFNEMLSEIERQRTVLSESRDQLEQRVEHRTGELQREVAERQHAQTELERVHGELLDASRQAGMAEIANNVLHNVGNVLNSVNISASLIRHKIRESKVRGLAKAVQLLNLHASDLGTFLTRNEKGRALPGYLNKLVTSLETEKHSVGEELDSLTRSVDHIKDIVATQQSYSGAISMVESVQINDLLEDALRMNAASIARHKITVVKHFAKVPLLLLDKHLVLQILVNLIGNARNAMDAVPDRSHKITLRMDIAEPADAPRLRICVEDNGEGIATENLARLFAHGFTTRKKGHGFGLHSCALAAKEMQGTITAHSDGPGMGATFMLELPIKLVQSIPRSQQTSSGMAQAVEV